MRFWTWTSSSSRSEMHPRTNCGWSMARECYLGIIGEHGLLCVVNMLVTYQLLPSLVKMPFQAEGRCCVTYHIAKSCWIVLPGELKCSSVQRSPD